MSVVAEAPSAAVDAKLPARTGALVRSYFILLPLLYYSNSGFPGATDSQTAAHSRLHQAGLLVVSIICSTFILKRVAVIFAASLKMRLVLALPVLAFLTTLWSVSPGQSLSSGVTLLCFTLFAIYLSETYTTDGQLDLIMLTGAVAVPASIILALFVPSIGVTPQGWRGIFVHKQQCAAAVTLFVVTALHWKPNYQIQRPLRIIYIVLCFVVIIMSQSRTGWLLSLFAVVLSFSLWFIRKMATKDALFLVLIAVPTLAGLAYLFTVFATLILTSVGKDPTLSERTVIWSAVWDAITQRPLLGYGYEAFWAGLTGASKNVVLISGWNVSQAQSGYLDLWLQFGVLGVIVLVLMTGQAAANILRTFRGAANDSFVRWCTVVILCNLIYNFGESDFGYLRILWFLFVMACIGLGKEAAALQSPRTKLVEQRATKMQMGSREEAGVGLV